MPDTPAHGSLAQPTPLGAPLVPSGGAGEARVHPDSIHATVRDVLRERDHLFLLHEALVDAERGVETAVGAPRPGSAEARRLAEFRRVLATRGDGPLNPERYPMCAGKPSLEPGVRAEIAGCQDLRRGGLE